MQYGEMIAQLKARGFTLKSEVSSHIGNVTMQYWEFVTEQGATITIPYSRVPGSERDDLPGALLALVNDRLAELSLKPLGVSEATASRPPRKQERQPFKPGIRFAG